MDTYPTYVKRSKRAFRETPNGNRKKSKERRGTGNFSKKIARGRAAQVTFGSKTRVHRTPRKNSKERKPELMETKPGASNQLEEQLKRTAAYPGVQLSPTSGRKGAVQEKIEGGRGEERGTRPQRKEGEKEEQVSSFKIPFATQKTKKKEEEKETGKEKRRKGEESEGRGTTNWRWHMRGPGGYPPAKIKLIGSVRNGEQSRGVRVKQRRPNGKRTIELRLVHLKNQETRGGREKKGTGQTRVGGSLIIDLNRYKVLK